MDITEAQAAKRTLEGTILIAIRSFEAATGASVECVRLTHLRLDSPIGEPRQSRTDVVGVTVEAHL